MSSVISIRLGFRTSAIHRPAVRPPARQPLLAPGFSKSRAVACRRVWAQGAATEALADATYQDLVLISPVPVLLIFWEERNNHSAEYAQEVDRLVAELGYGDKLRALRVNIETCPVISEDCCIMDVPTLMIFKGGVEQEALRGRLSMQEVSAAIKKYM